MKKIFVLIFSLSICFSVYAQNKDLLFFKLPDKHRTVKIKPGAWISFTQEPFTLDSLEVKKYVSGILNFAKNDSINMEVEKMHTGIKLDSVLTKQITISTGKWPAQTFKTESYAVSDMCSIRYQNRSGRFFSEIGIYLAWASFVTAAVVAPLVSINYKEGTFNMDTYKSVVMAGGIGFGISIPILIFSGQKSITLEPCRTEYIK
ncbi:MAG: hypothetical protein ABFS05_04580, partial [Bacteroidota bacterium]